MALLEALRDPQEKHDGDFVKRRDLFAAAIAPAFAAEFLRDGNRWSSPEELAAHIYQTADALERRAKKTERPKKKKRGGA